MSNEEVETLEGVDEEVIASASEEEEDGIGNTLLKEETHDFGHEPGDVNGNTLDAPDPYLQAYSATMDSITSGNRGNQNKGNNRRGRGRSGNVNGNRASGNQKKGRSGGGRGSRGMLPPDDPYWQFGMPVEYWGLSVGKAGQYAEGGGNKASGNQRGKNASSRNNESGEGGQKKKRRRRRRRGRRGGQGANNKAATNNSGGESASPQKDSE